jgi:hypothetical protein
MTEPPSNRLWFRGLDTPPLLPNKAQGVQPHLFIKGPIPLWWLQTASRECGFSSVALGLLLFYRQGLKRPPAPISRKEAEMWGLTRNTRDSALKKLSQKRLITIQTVGRRKCPLIDPQTRKPGV